MSDQHEGELHLWSTRFGGDYTDWLGRHVDPNGFFVVPERGEFVCECVSEADADQIIADHIAATQLAEALSQRQAAVEDCDEAREAAHQLADATEALMADWEQVQAKLQAAVEEAERLRGELHEWVNMYPASLVLAPDKLLERTLARCAGLKGKLAAANQDREKARRIAGDLSNQAYESTGLGGVFFDTLHDLRHALASQPPAEAEGDRRR